jgi:3-oxoadipate enol-lactonase
MSTILWLHGFPLTSRIFEKQRAIAGAEHLMPDLPPLESMDEYARFAVAQLDARGIEKATFAGLSMGGYICFAVWRLFPGRVDGLILIDTRETADTEEARKGRYDSIAKVEQHGVAAVADAMLPKMVTSDALKPAVREIMMAASPEFVKSALRAMAARPDSSSLLPTISVPTVVIVGENDTITPPADAERMAKAIPNARLVRIPDAAHLSNYEQPEAFNASATGSAP